MSRPQRSRRPSAKVTGEITQSATKHLTANYLKLAEQGSLPAETNIPSQGQGFYQSIAGVRAPARGGGGRLSVQMQQSNSSAQFEGFDYDVADEGNEYGYYEDDDKEDVSYQDDGKEDEYLEHGEASESDGSPLAIPRQINEVSEGGQIEQAQEQGEQISGMDVDEGSIAPKAIDLDAPVELPKAANREASPIQPDVPSAKTTQMQLSGPLLSGTMEQFNLRPEAPPATAAPKPIKRGPGRPPLNKPPPSATNTDLSPSPGIPVPGRGRGRPPGTTKRAYKRNPGRMMLKKVGKTKAGYTKGNYSLQYGEDNKLKRALSKSSSSTSMPRQRYDGHFVPNEYSGMKASDQSFRSWTFHPHGRSLEETSSDSADDFTEEDEIESEDDLDSDEEEFDENTTERDIIEYAVEQAMQPQPRDLSFKSEGRYADIVWPSRVDAGGLMDAFTIVVASRAATGLRSKHIQFRRDFYVSAREGEGERKGDDDNEGDETAKDIYYAEELKKIEKMMSRELLSQTKQEEETHGTEDGTDVDVGSGGKPTLSGGFKDGRRTRPSLTTKSARRRYAQMGAKQYKEDAEKKQERFPKSVGAITSSDFPHGQEHGSVKHGVGAGFGVAAGAGREAEDDGEGYKDKISPYYNPEMAQLTSGPRTLKKRDPRRVQAIYRECMLRALLGKDHAATGFPGVSSSMPRDINNHGKSADLSPHAMGPYGIELELKHFNPRSFEANLPWRPPSFDLPAPSSSSSSSLSSGQSKSNAPSLEQPSDQLLLNWTDIISCFHSQALTTFTVHNGIRGGRDEKNNVACFDSVTPSPATLLSLSHMTMPDGTFIGETRNELFLRHALMTSASMERSVSKPGAEWYNLLIIDALYLCHDAKENGTHRLQTEHARVHVPSPHERHHHANRRLFNQHLAFQAAVWNVYMAVIERETRVREAWDAAHQDRVQATSASESTSSSTPLIFPRHTGGIQMEGEIDSTKENEMGPSESKGGGNDDYGGKSSKNSHSLSGGPTASERPLAASAPASAPAPAPDSCLSASYQASLDAAQRSTRSAADHTRPFVKATIPPDHYYHLPIEIKLEHNWGSFDALRHSLLAEFPLEAAVDGKENGGAVQQEQQEQQELQQEQQQTQLIAKMRREWRSNSSSSSSPGTVPPTVKRAKSSGGMIIPSASNEEKEGGSSSNMKSLDLDTLIDKKQQHKKTQWLLKLDAFCCQPVLLSSLITSGVQTTIKALNKAHGGSNPSLDQCIPWKYPPILGRREPLKQRDLGKINAERLMNLNNLTLIDNPLDSGENATSQQRYERLNYGKALLELMEVTVTNGSSSVYHSAYATNGRGSTNTNGSSSSRSGGGSGSTSTLTEKQRANQKAAMQHRNMRLMLARQKLRLAEKRAALREEEKKEGSAPDNNPSALGQGREAASATPSGTERPTRPTATTGGVISEMDVEGVPKLDPKQLLDSMSVPRGR